MITSKRDGDKARTPGQKAPPPQEVIDALKNNCSLIADINKSIADLKTTKDELMAEVEELAEKHRIIKLPGDTWNMSYCEGKMYLDEGMLLELGVTMDIIQAAKRRGKGYYQVKRNAG